MHRITYFLVVFISFLFVPSISSAQIKNFSNHIDFLQVGKTSSGSLAGIAGYHFATLEMKRFSTLGLGVAWLGVNDTNSTSPYQDIALTIPIATIRLGKPSHSDKVPYPTFFFNVNYGYGLIHKEHGVFVGISFGSS